MCGSSTEIKEEKKYTLVAVSLTLPIYPPAGHTSGAGEPSGRKCCADTEGGLLAASGHQEFLQFRSMLFSKSQILCNTIHVLLNCLELPNNTGQIAEGASRIM